MEGNVLGKNLVNPKIEQLKQRVRSLGSAVIAFSGGVDSAVLTTIAHEVLGQKMLAVTAVSPSIPSRDYDSAVDFCKKRKIPHRIVETAEFENEDFLSNPENRCFYCKSGLFEALTKVAAEKGFAYVVEGTNASEIKGHRPGFQAAQKMKNVATPYVDIGLTKDDVREIARALKIEVAERPSTACLASRIPTGTRIEPALLKNIDIAENYLLGLGLRQVRVRHYGELARIESDDAGMKTCLDRRTEIVGRLKELGWKKVALDMEGYRTGGGM
jgi:uncharacterized protein